MITLFSADREAAFRVSALGTQQALKVQHGVRPRKEPDAFAINHTYCSPLIKIKSKENKTCWKPIGSFFALLNSNAKL